MNERDSDNPPIQLPNPRPNEGLRVSYLWSSIRSCPKVKPSMRLPK